MNNYLKLICEKDFHDLDILIEQDNKNTKKSVKIRGPFIVAGEENANKRIYLEPVMESAVTEFQRDFISQNRAVGELNHPTTIDVDYNNACHKILSLTKEGNLWIGESEVITGHPKGDILTSLLEHDIKVGMSTRGVGNINEAKEVDEYKLITVDVVHEPSGPGCFMEGILEAKNYMINEHGDIMEIAYNKLEKSLNKLPRYSDEKSLQISDAIKNFFMDF